MYRGEFPARDEPTVLIVGRQESRASVENSLRVDGYNVMLADDGSKAVRLAYEASPSLVLIEVDLPDMSGFEACRAIRAELTMPIMLVSTYREDVEEIDIVLLNAQWHPSKGATRSWPSTS